LIKKKRKISLTYQKKKKKKEKKKKKKKKKKEKKDRSISQNIFIKKKKSVFLKTLQGHLWCLSNLQH